MSNPSRVRSGAPALRYDARDRSRYVALLKDIIKRHPAMTIQNAAARAAREGTAEDALYPAPSNQTVIRWAREEGVPLKGVAPLPEKGTLAAARFAREDQRARLSALINLEIRRTQIVMRQIGRVMGHPNSLDEIPVEIASVNFAQRLGQLASAHATIATQSRADELHGKQLGDLPVPATGAKRSLPAATLDEWDGEDETLPEDMSPNIVDIATSRARASLLTGGDPA